MPSGFIETLNLFSNNFSPMLLVKQEPNNIMLSSISIGFFEGWKSKFIFSFIAKKKSDETHHSFSKLINLVKNS
jgi:hypothetical protein